VVCAFSPSGRGKSKRNNQLRAWMPS